MNNKYYKAQAIKINAFGDPSELQTDIIDVKAPVDHELLIETHAAGVNRPDIFQRKGLYPPPTGASDILGLEVAGIVKEVGGKVSRFKVGDAVMALLTGGGYAELAVTHEDTVLHKPSKLSFIEAAGVPETFFTVWSNLFMRAHLKPTEKLLVHGGTSGIGTTAIMIAKALNISVIATAGTDEKCAACINLGATTAINYKKDNFEEIITREHGGVDVILDMVSGDYVQKNINCLNPDGRLVIIAFLRGSQAQVDFRPLMMKRLSITGSTLRARSHKFKRTIAQQIETQLFPLFNQGKLTPIIHQTFSLSEAKKAHELMETSAHIGKIILKTKD